MEPVVPCGREISVWLATQLQRLGQSTRHAALAFWTLMGGELVYAMVDYAWSGLGSSFGPPLLLALWWKRTSKWGVLAGMIGGMTSTVIWKNVAFLGDLLDIKAATFIVSAILVVVVSLIVPDRPEDPEPVTPPLRFERRG